MSTITFITGANKGLGYETARRLIELGQTVVIGARDPERGQAAADQLRARFVAIDVTDDDSVALAAEDVEAHEGRVDVLINNAGMHGPPPGADVNALDGPTATTVFQTNVIGIVRVTHAFLLLLRRSEHPTIVNLTSGTGSVAITSDPDRAESHVMAPAYTASKAAVTMLSLQYAKGLPGIRVNIADPGWTSTDLNGHSGPQTVTEGTDAVVSLATESPDAGTGRLIDRDGPIRW